MSDEHDFTRRKAALFNALRLHGVAVAKAHYSGSGDDGSISYSDYEDTEGNPVAVRGVQVEKPGIGSGLLTDWVEEFCWSTIIGNSMHDGFWNDDGGEGRIELDVVNNTIKMHHNDYITTTVYSGYSIDENGAFTSLSGAE